jgi:3-oxoadipate enol-lactonase
MAGADVHLPTIVLANGLGGPCSAWLPYVRRWRRRFRLIFWDYRGSYGSVLAHDGVDLSVRTHASDLRCVLDEAGVDRAFFFGWSMGVQVGLEFYSDNPTRLQRLCLINGTFGRPLRGVALPFSEQTLGPLVKGAGRLERLGSLLLRGFTGSAVSYEALLSLNLLAPGLPRAHFQTMMNDFRSIDLKLYFQLLSELGKHDAEAILSGVRVPSLVIVGSRDFLTPPRLARRIARDIENAELFVISGATHYAPVEYPTLVAERIEKFFAEENQIRSCPLGRNLPPRYNSP